MTAKQPAELTFTRSWEEMRNEAIDTLAVFAVRESHFGNVTTDPDLGVFIGTLTGFVEEDVQLRLETITAGNEKPPLQQPLMYDDESFHLKVNPESPRAQELDYSMATSLPIGNSFFPTRTLRMYLEEYRAAQSRMNSVMKMIATRASTWAFDPEVPAQVQQD